MKKERARSASYLEISFLKEPNSAKSLAKADVSSGNLLLFDSVHESVPENRREDRAGKAATKRLTCRKRHRRFLRFHERNRKDICSQR